MSFEKSDKFGSGFVVDDAQLNHAVIVQFSGVARGRSILTCVEAELHFVNIDFELY